MIPDRPQNSTIYDFLSPPLILVTPFISFVTHHDYSYAAAELWICVAGLVAIGLFCGAIMAFGGTWLRVLGTAGLLTLFVDLQFDWLDTLPQLWAPIFGIGILLLCWSQRDHLSRIVAPVAATILASTFALSVLGETKSSRLTKLRASDQPAAASGGPPTLVHILLDEHIGVEGIPTDIQHGLETKSLLKTFFEYYGFRLYGRAYSRYHQTRNSLSHMVNYPSKPLDNPSNTNLILHPNRYFEDMRSAGYNIHAIQIPYLRVCSPSENTTASCFTDDQSGIGSLQHVDVSVEDKAILIYKIYGSLSVINKASGKLNGYIQRIAWRHGWDWPDWWSNEQGMAPLRALTTISALGGEVARAAPGQMFFAHLLVPHFPYVFDARCNVRKPAEWEPAYDEEPLPRNTIESRKRRYLLYLEQVQCLYRRLGEIFEEWRRAGVFDRLKIIIQGDHGSRIYLHEPLAANRDELLVSDYADAFSTLLAVKAPGYEPGYDLRWISVQDLLPQLATPGEALPTAQEASARPTSSDQLPYVYLEQDDSPRMVKQPLPRFGDPGPAVN
jgi:hypothetical protein